MTPNLETAIIFARLAAHQQFMADHAIPHQAWCDHRNSAQEYRMKAYQACPDVPLDRPLDPLLAPMESIPAKWAR